MWLIRLTTNLSALVTYCCVSDYPQTKQLKTTNICYIIVSEGQEPPGTLVEWFWFRVSNKLEIRCYLGLQSHLKAGLGLKDPLPRSFMCLLAGLSSACALGLRVSVSPSVDLSIGLPECPQNMTAGFSQRQWWERERERGSKSQNIRDRRHRILWPNFGICVSSLLCILLVTQTSLGPVSERTI